MRASVLLYEDAPVSLAGVVYLPVNFDIKTLARGNKKLKSISGSVTIVFDDGMGVPLETMIDNSESVVLIEDAVTSVSGFRQSTLPSAAVATPTTDVVFPINTIITGGDIMLGSNTVFVQVPVTQLMYRLTQSPSPLNLFSVECMLSFEFE